MVNEGKSMSVVLAGRSLEMLKVLVFGEAEPLEVPERVRTAIERQQAHRQRPVVVAESRAR